MCQMFAATVSNSHILQMSVLWLNHTAPCLSISISVCITIYILNSHSGLNIAPANLLYSFRHQSNFARYYAAHCTPWGERPAGGTVKLATRMIITQSEGRAWHREAYGHGPMGYFRQQVIWLLKRKKHHRVIYSGDGTQVFRSCEVRQQKGKEG